MAVKYVKDFQFDKSFGYTGSPGTDKDIQAAKSAGSLLKAARSVGTGQGLTDKDITTLKALAKTAPKTATPVDSSTPTPEETVKMRQAREYMREDKATSDAAKREMGFKKGGLKVIEKATGETYPSRKAMVKHEKTETPRMQKEEVVQKQVVRGPAMAAGRDPRIPMFKCGGKAKK